MLQYSNFWSQYLCERDSGSISRRDSRSDPRRLIFRCWILSCYNSNIFFQRIYYGLVTRRKRSASNDVSFVSNGHNKTAGFSRLGLWRKRKSSRPQEAKGPSSVYYEAAWNRYDGKSRTYGFETPLRHFLLKVPFTRSLYLSPLRQKIRPFEVVPEIVSFSRSHFQFCSNKTSSMKMREQSGKGGFLSKIQFNARKSPIYFPIHGQNGIAQSLASMPQPTRQFYISPLAFSPIRIIHGSTI